jgi:hypothetical protein
LKSAQNQKRFCACFVELYFANQSKIGIHHQINLITSLKKTSMSRDGGGRPIPRLIAKYLKEIADCNAQLDATQDSSTLLALRAKRDCLLAVVMDLHTLENEPTYRGRE